VQAKRLNRLIEDIYEAAVTPGGLDTLAASIAAALDTDSGFIAFLRRPVDGEDGAPDIIGLPSATANFDDWARAAYAEHYHQRNIWFREGVKRGFPAVVLGEELVDSATFLRSEWHEYCLKLDAFHVLGAQFHIDKRLSVQFGAHRRRQAQAFDERSRRQVQLILPHLQRALQVHVRLGLAERMQEATLELLESLSIGVIVVAADGRIVFANLVAEKLMDRHDGLCVVGGRLSAANPASAAALARAIWLATTSPNDSGGVAQIARPSGAPLGLLVSPIRGRELRFGFAEGVALALFSDPARGADNSLAAYAATYKLTPAETRFLEALLVGETVGDYAKRTGVRIGTVRTHLKRLLAKTGNHRQIDLIRTFASDPLLALLRRV
jgi:DNA-binding CsgD family transcriptional regulator/PAS domain-containing protein